MSYKPIRTYANGDIMVPDYMNTIRSNFEAGIPAIAAAVGDLFPGSESQAIVRKPVGANGRMLAAKSSETGGIDWSIGLPTAEKVAKGDLFPASGADQLIRYPAGPNGAILVADSSQAGGVRWRHNAAAKFRNVNSQTVENETYTTIDFNTEVYDYAGAASIATDSYTAPEDGHYLITASCILTGSTQAAGYLGKKVKVAVVDGDDNVLSILGSMVRMTGAGSNYYAVAEGSDILYLTKGTVIYPKYWHNYGSAQSFNAANSGQEFSVARLGA